MTTQEIPDVLAMEPFNRTDTPPSVVPLISHALSLVNTTATPPSVVPLVSHALRDLWFLVGVFAVVYPMSLLGLFTNTASAIVYYKMGLSESSNVKFLVLSVFDFLVSLTSFLSRLLYSSMLNDAVTGGVARYIGHCLSHAMIVMIGGSTMMTALIATERCVCVVMPLKVKTLLSRRRSLLLVLAVVGFHVAFLILVYSDPGPPYDAHPKKMAFYYFALYVVPSTACFFIVILATILLVIKLRVKQRWRKGTASQCDKNSDKENRLIQTIVAISTLFIICFLPTVGIFLAQTLYPSLHYASPYLGSLVEVLFNVSGSAQAVSSTVNIFFYYKMSSRFKSVYSACFGLRRHRESNGGQEAKRY